MHVMMTIFMVLGWVMVAMKLAIIVVGVVGAIVVASTRSDAFEAGDRRPKWQWFGILVVSTLLVLFTRSFIWLFGIVAIGVYWFDVHPQLKSIQNGECY